LRSEPSAAERTFGPYDRSRLHVRDSTFRVTTQTGDLERRVEPDEVTSTLAASGATLTDRIDAPGLKRLMVAASAALDQARWTKLPDPTPAVTRAPYAGGFHDQ
jgi:hypothetical protein